MEGNRNDPYDDFGRYHGNWLHCSVGVRISLHGWKRTLSQHTGLLNDQSASNGRIDTTHFRVGDYDVMDIITFNFSESP